MSTNERSFIYQIWDFLCSLKLTLFLIISLAITSIIGTVLPQGALPPEYVAQISPTKLQIYSKLGFYDMYHSWWFITLLYMLSLNLISCSMKRLPHVFKYVSEPLLVLEEGMRGAYSLKKEINWKEPVERGKELFSTFIEKEFAPPVITEKNGEFHLFAQKNSWSRLGVYVVHFSILVIFIGAIIGSVAGYKGFVAIIEGTSVTTFDNRNGQQMPLGFELLCEKFSVEFYPTGAPKEFKSVLTVLENGKPVPGYTKVDVIVNDPLTYKGITFYQSSYGQAEEGGEHFLTVVSRSGGEPERFRIQNGALGTLKDGTVFRILETTPDVSPFAPGFSGPAARLEVTGKGGKPQVFVSFKNHQDVNAQRDDPMIFNYEGSSSKQYTGLQVTKDPGVWVVWLGCTLMIVGLCIAFFMSHKRIWIIVSKGHVRMYGNSNKNPAAFQMQFEEIAEKFKEVKI